MRQSEIIKLVIFPTTKSSLTLQGSLLDVHLLQNIFFCVYFKHSTHKVVAKCIYTSTHLREGFRIKPKYGYPQSSTW